MLNRYDIKFQFFLIGDINDILMNSKNKNNIWMKDHQIIDEKFEYLKEFYNKYHIDHRLKVNINSLLLL